MKIDKKSYVSAKTEVKIPTDSGEIILFANEIGYVQIAGIMADEETRMAKLLVASITNEKGEKFTLEETMALKQNIAEPLLKAALKVNGIGDDEKN